MKKFLFIITFAISFFLFSTNIFASGRVTLNYDNFYDLIEQYPVYSDIINGIRERLDNTDYRYAIYIRSSNSSSCNNSYNAWTQSEYDSRCSITTVMSNGGYKVAVDIFNPTYYNSDNTIQYLYFGIGSGSSSSQSLNGLIIGTEYNSTTIYVNPSNFQLNSYNTTLFLSNTSDLQLIDSWLLSPTYTTRSTKYVSVGQSNNNSDWVANYVPWFIFKNFNTLNKYAYYQGSNLGTLNMRYILNGETNEFVVNEETDFIITQGEVLPPSVNDLGSGIYTFNGRSLKISSNNFSGTIICPNDRPFSEDFCYINNTDFVSSSDMSNMNLILDFDLGNNYASFSEGHYYSFTFRVSSTSTLNVASMGVASGQISTNVVINQVIKHENGVFTDYQIIFTPNSSFTSSYTLSRIYIIFNGFIDSDYDSYSYGAYKNYRYRDFGTSQPSIYDINNDYTINNIDSITSDSSNWFNNLQLRDRGLSQFVTAPLRIMNYIISNQDTACSVMTFTLPYFNNSVSLVCMSNVIGNYFPSLLALYQVIVGGILAYYIALGYVHTITNVTNPDNDNIEVINL